MTTSIFCVTYRLMALLGLFLLSQGTLSANEAHQQLKASSEQERRAAFRLILVGAGERCERVIRTFFQGETAAKNAVWNVDCGTDGAYSINIAPDEGGSTKLIACNMVQRLQGTECFKPLKQ